MIDWGAKGSKRIAQNASNLMAMTQFELMYDLGRGVNPNIIDKTSNAEDLAVAEAHRVISTYEPRAKIEKVEYKEGVINVEVSGGGY